MNWLRSKLRAWLGIDEDYRHITDMAQGLALNERISALETQIADFKAALKKRAATSVRLVPRYVDYETAQVDALEDFKERANGVQS